MYSQIGLDLAKQSQKAAPDFWVKCVSHDFPVRFRVGRRVRSVVSRLLSSPWALIYAPAYNTVRPVANAV